MRRILIVIGVLGSGTGLSFAAAAAILLASPEGRLVANTYQGNPIGVLRGGPVPMPMPLPVQGIAVDDTGLVIAPPANRIERVAGVKQVTVVDGTDGAATGAEAPADQ